MRIRSKEPRIKTGMKKTLLLVMSICLSALVRAEVFPSFGVDSVSSEFFRE